MTKVTLYGYPTSPYVMKVACYLKYKKLPFHFEAVNPITAKEIKFTSQRQVPVLKIDDEWRKDSTPLGIWLNEKFPEHNILGENEADTKKIMQIDQWISEQLITARFRHAVQWESVWDSVRNGWILASAVNDATKIPMVIRWMWPILVRRAKFIVDMVNMLDLNEPLPEMRQRLCDEFVSHLGDGPFLGGRDSISLADLSAYPTLISGYVMGMHIDSPYLRNDKILKWCTDVQSEMPANPLLIPESLFRRQMFWKS